MNFLSIIIYLIAGLEQMNCEMEISVSKMVNQSVQILSDFMYVSDGKNVILQEVVSQVNCYPYELEVDYMYCNNSRKLIEYRPNYESEILKDKYFISNVIIFEVPCFKSKYKGGIICLTKLSGNLTNLKLMSSLKKGVEWGHCTDDFQCLDPGFSNNFIEPADCLCEINYAILGEIDIISKTDGSIIDASDMQYSNSTWCSTSYCYFTNETIEIKKLSGNFINNVIEVVWIEELDVWQIVKFTSSLLLSILILGLSMKKEQLIVKKCLVCNQFKSAETVSDCSNHKKILLKQMRMKKMPCVFICLVLWGLSSFLLITSVEASHCNTHCALMNSVDFKPKLIFNNVRHRSYYPVTDFYFRSRTFNRSTCHQNDYYCVEVTTPTTTISSYNRPELNHYGKIGAQSKQILEGQVSFKTSAGKTFTGGPDSIFEDEFEKCSFKFNKITNNNITEYYRYEDNDVIGLFCIKFVPEPGYCWHLKDEFRPAGSRFDALNRPCNIYTTDPKGYVTEQCVDQIRLEKNFIVLSDGIKTKMEVIMEDETDVLIDCQQKNQLSDKTFEYTYRVDNDSIVEIIPKCDSLFSIYFEQKEYIQTCKLKNVSLILSGEYTILENHFKNKNNKTIMCNCTGPITVVTNITEIEKTKPKDIWYGIYLICFVKLYVLVTMLYITITEPKVKCKEMVSVRSNIIYNETCE